MKIISCPNCGVVFDLEALDRREAGFVDRCPCGCYLTQEDLDKANIILRKDTLNG